MITTIQDAVRQLLPAKRKTNAGGWTSFNAVCCEHNGESRDTRGRAGFAFNTDGSTSYHCFNCNFKASYQPGRHLTYKFRKLLSWLGASESEVKRLVIDAIRVKEFVAPEALVEAEEAEPINFKPRPLPEDAKTFSQWMTFYALKSENTEYIDIPVDFAHAVNYAYDRKIDTKRYEFYYTPDTEHNYHKRVIIPLYWRRQLIGTTARAFDDSIKPKYYSDYEPNYVFNVDRQTPEKQFVVVVEGPFDAMAIDGVAIMSNECSEVQADIIDSLGREVIVVPDADRAGSKLIEQAIEYGWSVSFPIWQREGAKICKDVAEAVAMYGRLFVLKSILAGRESSRLKIELRKKKLHG